MPGDDRINREFGRADIPRLKKMLVEGRDFRWVLTAFYMPLVTWGYVDDRRAQAATGRR